MMMKVICMFTGLTRKDFKQALASGIFMAVLGYAVIAGFLLAFQGNF
jgi:hypothetical protein